MLYQQTVSPKLLEILTALMSNPYFGEFYLVGGTSLALQIGHRESIDGSEFLVLKSLTYFDDADLDESPKMYYPIDCEEIKLSVKNEVRNYMNSI